MTIDFIPICNLCEECVWKDECVLTATFPVFECIDFDDGQEGDFPDGDNPTPWQLETRAYQQHGHV